MKIGARCRNPDRSSLACPVARLTLPDAPSIGTPLMCQVRSALPRGATGRDVCSPAASRLGRKPGWLGSAGKTRGQPVFVTPTVGLLAPLLWTRPVAWNSLIFRLRLANAARSPLLRRWVAETGRCRPRSSRASWGRGLPRAVRAGSRGGGRPLRHALRGARPSRDSSAAEREPRVCPSRSLSLRRACWGPPGCRSRESGGTRAV